MTALVLTIDNPITSAIRALYGFARGVDEGIADVIDSMKGSENSAVSRTGAVLEGAKFGFGIGYITPVIVIAVGQLILGNPLSAVWTGVTAITLSNPIAMTCGAIGAIYYGWQALSNDERNAILLRLMEAFNVGVELIKAMVNFITTTMKELLSAENLAEVKKFLVDAATTFGKSMSDITHAVVDGVVDTFEAVTGKVAEGAAGARDFIRQKLKKDEVDPKFAAPAEGESKP